MSIFKYSLRVLFVLLFGSFFINIRSAYAKISVIVPIYNEEKRIGRCLDSIINQTYKDLEIICLNDSSTDGSKNILEEYAKKDSRIKVIDQDENKGVSAARNKGIDNATGEWITFVDADDYLTQILTYEIAMSKKEEGTDILGWNHCCEEEFEYSNNKNTVEPKVCEGKNKLHDLFAQPNSMFNSKSQYWNGAVWSYLYRSKMLKDNKLRFEDLYNYEDAGFNICAFIVAKKVQFIDDELYLYSLVKGSLTHNKNNVNSIASSAFNLVNYVLEFCKNKGILKCHKDKFLVFLTHILFNRTLEVIRRRDPINKFHFARLIFDKLKEYYGNKLEKYCSEGLENIDGCTCEKCLEAVKLTSKQLKYIYKLSSKLAFEEGDDVGFINSKQLRTVSSLIGKKSMFGEPSNDMNNSKPKDINIDVK